MQPSSMLGAGAAHGVSGVTACLSSPQVAGLADHMSHQQLHFSSQFDQASQPHNQAMDDFIEQMFSMPSWPDVAGGKVPWECNNNVTTNPNNNNTNTQTQKLFTMSLMPPGIGTQGLGSQENDDHGADSNMQYSFDESVLASRLRQHHLSGNNTGINSTANQASSQGGITESTSPGRSMVLQLSTGNSSASQLLASIGNPVMTRSPSSGGSSGSEGGMLPLPLSLGQGKPCDSTPNEAHLLGERSREVDVEASFKTANAARDSSPGGIYTTFCGTPVGSSRTGRPIAQQFHPQPGQVPMQSYGGMPQPQHQHQHQAPPMPGAVAAPTRPRVRARRGQATDPHSIAERVCFPRRH